MSYERMKKEEKRLRQEIGKIVAAAEEQDRPEDEEFGPDFVGREGNAEPEVRPHLVETRAMQKKLRTARGPATYEKRKHLVEPVFGWIKQVLGFRQFSLHAARGREARSAAGVDLVPGNLHGSDRLTVGRVASAKTPPFSTGRPPGRPVGQAASRCARDRPRRQ